jgi:hypothetical protein
MIYVGRELLVLFLYQYVVAIQASLDDREMTTEFYESDFSHVCLPSLCESSIFMFYSWVKYFGESTKGIANSHASNCG